MATVRVAKQCVDIATVIGAQCDPDTGLHGDRQPLQDERALERLRDSLNGVSTGRSAVT
jgi:hypothetical protein